MRNELKAYSEETKKKFCESLKLEGEIKAIDITEQEIIEVSTDVPKELEKVNKYEKMDFETYKIAYKDLIDEACIAEIGNADDKKIWEDTAKEMYLKSANYIPQGDEYEPKEELDKLEESKSIKIRRLRQLLDEAMSWIGYHIHEDDVPSMLAMLAITNDEYEGNKEITTEFIEPVLNKAIGWITEHCPSVDDEKEVFINDMKMSEDELKHFGIDFFDPHSVEECKIEESRDRVAETLSKFIYDLTNEKDNEKYGYTAWSGNQPAYTRNGIKIYEVYRNGQSVFTLDDIKEAVLKQYPELTVFGSSMSGIFFTKKNKPNLKESSNITTLSDIKSKLSEEEYKKVLANYLLTYTDWINDSDISSDGNMIEDPLNYEEKISDLAQISDILNCVWRMTGHNYMFKEKKQEDQYEMERRKGRPNLTAIAKEVFEYDDYYINVVDNFKSEREFIIEHIAEVAAEYNLKEQAAWAVMEKIYKMAKEAKNDKYNKSGYVLYIEDCVDGYCYQGNSGRSRVRIDMIDSLDVYDTIEQAEKEKSDYKNPEKVKIMRYTGGNVFDI